MESNGQASRSASMERLYMTEPDDFSKISIVPTAEEILSNREPFLRPNLVKGKYPSTRTYLDVQFRLLREDFVAPLREAIEEFLNNESAYSSGVKKFPSGAIRFYYNVKLLNVEHYFETTIYLMEFTMTQKLKRVKWDKSNRLLVGSLLLLTPDKFRTIYFATVTRRDDDQVPRGIIGITWEGQRPPDLYGDFEFLMVECEVYFESYRHTLKALQDMVQPAPPHYDVPLFQKYRMAKYIVDMTIEKVPPPQYLTEPNHRLDFSMLLACNIKAMEDQLNNQLAAENEVKECWAPVVSKNLLTSPDEKKIINWKSHSCHPLDLAMWPTADDLGMDDSQYSAFQSIISQELSVVQGPPGTGKTYIGLQVVKLFLSNPKIIWRQPSARSTDDIHAASRENPDLPPSSEVDESVVVSPILIVCYTNHALDQFLEGIISIMKTCGLNPQDNLIRVGGRSKVEELKEFSINKRREHYQQFRKFDPKIATYRKKVKARLRKLQDFRSDLKDEFKSLRNPQGIVNFKQIGSYAYLYEDRKRKGHFDFVQQMKNKLPVPLHGIFLTYSLLEWLGLNSSFFRYEDFNPEKVLRDWFSLVPVRAVKIHGNKMNGTKIPGSLVTEETTEDFDDEAYEDMDNLLANRLDEEIVYEISRSNRTPINLSYLLEYGYGSVLCVQRERFIQQYNLPEVQNDTTKIEELLSDWHFLDMEETFYTNRKDFVSEVLKAYQEGRIQLPVVTPDLLKRAHEQVASLRPSISEKWAIYFYMIQETKKLLSQKINDVECSILKAQRELVEINNNGDGIILREAKVVGLTTTGAAKYSQLLRMMKSRIVIMEEAAEVLESSVITSITEDCEHLILIGDHQQLRPATTVYKLAKDYNLEISLFERLIKNNLSWQHLTAQHRMRPEICSLLVPTIYKNLENHPVVLKYPNVEGMAKNLFFITHTEFEKADCDSMTKSNEHEARVLVKLCRHLLLQGYYHQSQITILTAYIGQMFLLKKIISQEERICDGVRVTVVDNFQGEENDIILLSLVRSNTEDRIGFLRTENRICVALSRAKQGLYIIGNMQGMLNAKSGAWIKISKELKNQESIGDQLELKCQIHGDIVKVRSPDDFEDCAPQGGCAKPCMTVIPNCGHICQKICHLEDRNHMSCVCHSKCRKFCKAGTHPCLAKCHGDSPCVPCAMLVERVLPCGHRQQLCCDKLYENLSLPCSELIVKKLNCGHQKMIHCCLQNEICYCDEVAPGTLDCGHSQLVRCSGHSAEGLLESELNGINNTSTNCMQLVTKELKCGHLKQMKCHEDPKSAVCTTLIQKELPCGHTSQTSCSLQPENVLCKILVDQKMPGCEHDVNIMCCMKSASKRWQCQNRCSKTLDCGHSCSLQCHANSDRNHLNYKCEEDCARSCVADHPCGRKHKCHEPCSTCKVIIEKTLECGHKIIVPCYTDVSNFKCQQPCQKIVPCSFKHPCKRRCSENCTPCSTLILKKSIDCEHFVRVECSAIAERSKCVEPVPAAAESLCGHSVEVACNMKLTVTAEDLLQLCHQPCGYKFDQEPGGCSHSCKGDCASCFQGRIHIKCAEMCDRILPCGHVCKFPCSKLCPPCEDDCEQSCEHSKCENKCGMICTGCKEDCTWSCEHKKCGKKCDEICDMIVCNEPCKKKLKCSHECIGMCGDPCPPFCRLCDKEVVENIFFGNEKEENSRFVFLEDCKHIIEVNKMDKLMMEDQEKGKVDVKRCPRCHQIIKKSVRYGRILKKKVNDVVAIRDMILGHIKREKLAEIENQMMGQLLKPDPEYCFNGFRKTLVQSICSVDEIQTKSGKAPVIKPKAVDQDELETIDNMLTWWREAEDNLKKPMELELSTDPMGWDTSPATEAPEELKHDLNEECLHELVTKYKTLFQMLLDKQRPLSRREVQDFDQEFDRLNDLYRLFRRRGIDSFETYGAMLVYDTVKNHLDLLKPYDRVMKMEFTQQLQKFDRLLKTGWTKVDRKRRAHGEIFTAMGMNANHWYRCVNNHFYTIGDFEAFNQTDNCPQCELSFAMNIPWTNATNGQVSSSPFWKIQPLNH